MIIWFVLWIYILCLGLLDLFAMQTVVSWFLTLCLFSILLILDVFGHIKVAVQTHLSLHLNFPEIFSPDRKKSTQVINTF